MKISIKAAGRTLIVCSSLLLFNYALVALVVYYLCGEEGNVYASNLLGGALLGVASAWVVYAGIYMCHGSENTK